MSLLGSIAIAMKEGVVTFIKEAHRYPRGVKILIVVWALYSTILGGLIWWWLALRPDLSRAGEVITKDEQAITEELAGSPTPPAPPPSRYRSLNLDPDELTDEELEDRLGQLFLVGFNGGWWQQKDLEPIARILIEEFGVGGVLLFERNIPFLDVSEEYFEKREAGFYESIARMKQESKQVTGLPLLVTTDFEGGDVQQIRGGLLTEMPSAMAVAGLQDENAAYVAGRIIGTELRAFGFNMNLAPVVDVNTNSHNDLIGDRSFGGDSELVRSMAVAFLRGQREGGVLAAAKHFPGHGSTGQGDETPGVPKSGLEPVSLAWALDPFRAMVRDDIPAIMTSHFEITAFSVEPVTYESSYTKGLLRGTQPMTLGQTTLDPLGYQGVLMSDDLCSPSITVEANIDNSREYAGRVAKAATKAFDAGHDLLIIGHIFSDDTSEADLRPSGKSYRSHLRLSEFREVFEALRHHIFESPDRAERIERLRQSLARIWGLKREIETLEAEVPAVPPFDALGEGRDGISTWKKKLIKHRRAHGKIARQLILESFSVLRLAPRAPDLSKLKKDARVAVIFPTRHTSFSSVATATTEDIRRNVLDYDISRALLERWEGRFTVAFHMHPRWPADEDVEALVNRNADVVTEPDTKATLFVVWSRRQWEMLGQTLERIDEKGGDLSRVLALVAAYPNLLDNPSEREKRHLDEITIVIAYRGGKIHGKTLADFLLEGRDRLKPRALPVRVHPWVDAVRVDLTGMNPESRWQRQHSSELGSTPPITAVTDAP